MLFKAFVLMTRKISKYRTLTAWNVLRYHDLNTNFRDLNLPSLYICIWDSRSSGMLRSVDWYLPTFRDYFSVPSSGVKSAKNNFFLDCLAH